MNKKVITAVSMIAFGLAGCGSTDEPQPIPTVTVTATPSETTSPGAPLYQNAIGMGWGNLAPKEKEAACFLYLVSPDEAWDSFDEGAEGNIPREEFEIFFDEKCEVFLNG